MEIQARAKINWTLNVTGKRPDGYHLLDMLMQPIALHDTLLIEEADSLSLTVEGTDGDQNPVSFSLPVHLTVEKPVAAASGTDDPVEEKARAPVLTCALAGGCGLLFLILIVQGALLTRKIHRLEEEKL